MLKNTILNYNNQGDTAHDYGKGFAEETLSLIEDFLVDIKNLEKVIKSE